MNLLSSLQQRLGFTRNEIKVIFFLTATFLAGLSVRWYDASNAKRQPVEAQFDYSQSDTEFAERSKLLAQLSSKSKEATPGKTKKQAPSSPVNINTATKSQLMQLPGIGEQYAERIIAYRDEHGPFKSAGDLLKVKGIGKKRMEVLKPLITVE